MGKHILNTPKTAIVDSLSGLTFLNPATEVYDSTLLLRSPAKDRVHLVCGGGGGHEPAHAAFVGEGMLSAAVSGQVFASPNAGQVEKALDKLSLAKGTLIVVKNYTGDVLQFGLAKERWAATHLNDNSVRMVVVGDDVAVPRSQGALTGRRGLAGTVLTYKLAGALGAQGGSIDELEHVAKIVAERCGTIGMGLEHCHVPGTEKGEAYLKDDEAEIGMGIHNEPGIRKVSPIPSAAKLVDEFLTTITSTTDDERSYVPFKNDGKDEVILMVNNLGGLPELELGIVAKEAADWLARKKITVKRAVAGSFMTSLNLPGFSLTLLLLPREPVSLPATSTASSALKFDSSLLVDLFDAPTDAPAWKWTYKGEPEMKVLAEGDESKVGKKQEKAGEEVKGPKPTDSKLFISALEAGLKALVAAEPEITRYDTIAGDGDAGLTLKAGAQGILDAIAQNGIPDDDVVAAMVAISAIVEKEMGGTSGGLYAIGLSGLSKGLLDAAKEKSSDTAGKEVWARALELALNTLYNYTRARPPSRTLVDPLSSFILTFSASPSDGLTHAFKAAHEAAEATRDLDAKAGRAAYVDQEKIREAAVPDAGAWGVWTLLQGIQKVIGAIETKLTKALGIKRPIVQGGMMWVGLPKLVAAVSNAGGLGILTGLTAGSPEGLRKSIREVRSLTDKPFAVNLTFLPSISPPPYEEYAKVIVEEKVKIAETAGGPAAIPIIKYLKSKGLIVIHKCTAVRHAQAAEKVGVDFLSIDGFECAGHPGEDDVGGLLLLALAARKLKTPYIASGGIGDGRGLAAAISLGAEGVNCGTVFMATTESYIHDNIKKAMVEASELDTTHIFRSLRNSARVFKNKIATEVVAKERRPGGVEFPELAPLVSGARGKKVYDEGDPDAGVWSSSGVLGLIEDVPSCAELLERMERDAEKILVEGATKVKRESKL
ncbi:uncharacterized protein JCM10292_004583 [Rhodotorula paludigena]|uniref:uncharacterized protein n=1 Tax=Rhodotorula paludigena TaxID=86838 RepID=UPI00317CFE09